MRITAFVTLLSCLCSAAAAQTSQLTNDLISPVRRVQIIFHTTDEDKDDDTVVVVTLYGTTRLYPFCFPDNHGDILMGSTQPIYGHFSDNTTSQTYDFDLHTQTCDVGGVWPGQPPPPQRIFPNSVVVHIEPNGHDTWHFRCHFIVTLEDGTVFESDSDDFHLDQVRKERRGYIGINPIPHYLSLLKNQSVGISVAPVQPAVAAVPPPAAAPSPPACSSSDPCVYVGYQNSRNKDRDPALHRLVGDFSRIDVGDSYGFSRLCQRVGKRCISVIDWEGKLHGCDEHDGYSKYDDGSRLAGCR
jgi:hypothetical protein